MQTRDEAIQVLPVLDMENLETHQAEMAFRIARIDMSCVFEKLLWDGQLPLEDCDAAEREFKRFVFLVGIGIAPLAMISPKIDLVWHQFVLFTHEYEKFCKIAVGFFIHHTPETKEFPIPLVAATNFLDAYEHFWGELPSIWLDSLEENIQLQYQSRPLLEKPALRWSGWTGKEINS